MKTLSSTKFVIHKDTYEWGTVYYVITENGHGVVQININFNEPDAAYVLGLSVTEDYRHMGVGGRLMSESERIIRTFPDIGKIYVAAENVEEKKWLLGWYGRLGYEMDAYDRKENRQWMVKKIK